MEIKSTSFPDYSGLKEKHAGRKFHKSVPYETKTGKTLTDISEISFREVLESIQEGHELIRGVDDERN